MPQEAVHWPVLIPELAGAVGVLFEEDTHAAVFQQGHGGVDRGAIEKQHRVLPSVAFVIADEDAHVAAFHRVGYAVQENVAAVTTVGGCQSEDVAVAGVGLHALPSSLVAPSLTAVGGVVVATSPALADADKHPSVGQFHQFGLVSAAVGAVGYLPCVAVVVAEDHKVIQRIAVALATHGGGKHDAAGMLSTGQP